MMREAGMNGDANKAGDLPLSFKRTGSVACLISIFIAVMGLAGYLPGMHLLGSVAPDYIPMAPSTAVSFILLSVIVIIYINRPVTGLVRPGIMLAAGSISIFGFLKCAEYFAGIEDGFEHAIVPALGRLGDIPVGIMSPSTGAGFFLAGTGVLLHVCKDTTKKEIKWVGPLAGILGSLLVLCGLTVFLGYIHGQPFLYGRGAIVPMAMTTAIAFLFLGAGMIAANGPKQIPVRVFVGSTVRSRLLRILVPLVVIIVFVEDIVDGIVTAKMPAAFYTTAILILSAGFAGIIVFWVVSFVGRGIDRVEAEKKALAAFPSEDPNPVFRIARDGKVLYANDAGEGVLKGWNTSVGKDVPERWLQVITETLKTGMPVMKEVRIGDRFLSFSVAPVMGGAYVNLYGRDITDRKRSEQALQASEAFLDRVIEQSPFATWISDAEGTLQRANPALKKFLNLTDEQLVGKYNVLKDPLVERQGLMPLFRSVFEEGKTIKFTCDWDGNDIPTMDLKGSKSVSIEAAMFPILTPAGKLTNVVLNWIDITDRKKAEKELRDSEKKSRTWLEYSPVCTKIVDLDLNLQFMSKAGVEGLRIDDITPFYGKPYPFSFYPKAFRDLMTKNLQKVKNTGEIVTQEAPVVDVEGNEVWFHSTLVPVNDDEGRIEHIMVVSVDTTERNKAEQELKKAKNEIEQWSKELEKRVRMQIEELKHSQEQLIVSEKLATIGRLAAGVAHELNSPLSGLLSLFRTYRKRGSVSVGEKEWGEILSACEYMAKVINDLNIFARTSGMAKEGLDLVEVLDSVMSFGLSRTKLKSAVVNRLYAGKSIKSKGDKGRLQQVFLNVLNNAVDAIPEGGRVNIDAGMTDQEGNSFAEIEFTDNGSGMSSETLEHIFDPFYTTKKAGEGVGLGMSIVHTIVKEHGGKITIDSSEGKGTTIKILLPPDTLAE